MKIEKTGIFVKIIGGLELVPEEFLTFALPESEERNAFVFAQIDHNAFAKFCVEMAKMPKVSFFVRTLEAIDN